MSTHLLVKVLARSGNVVGRMKVLPYATLAEAWKKGTVEALSYENSAVDAIDIPEDAIIIFVSHRWWSSKRAKADREGWPKAGILINELTSRVEKDFGCSNQNLYFWLEYF
eukprot:4858805-Heterocapsa_arctica.AAC.1